MRAVLVLALLAALTACATKHSGRVTPLSEPQMFAMTCDEIDAGLAEVAALEQRIQDNSNIDFRSFVAFGLDFGIGNRIERRRATESARLRRAQLEGLRFERGCVSAASAE